MSVESCNQMTGGEFAPVLYMVSPCYNEEEVLPVSSELFLEHLETLIQDGFVSAQSRVLFVDDGSSDGTWQVISDLAQHHNRVEGLQLSCNRGHQNALLAGLMEVKDRCDVSISLDCDGQHDPAVMKNMIANYQQGNDIVYAVRSSRDTDGFFKKVSSQAFYSLMKTMGVRTIRNAADFRLMSKRSLDALAGFPEVNLFLRGLVPLVGFQSSTVMYECAERMAGKSHYPLKKMLTLASDGITSMSVQPLHLITGLGFVVALIGLVWIIYALVVSFLGQAVQGWASVLCVVCLLGGVQLLSLGVIGEYVGKIYLETKHRPRYIIRDHTKED